MDYNVTNLLSCIEKRTDISVDYSSVSTLARFETDRIEGIETLDTPMMGIYYSEISIMGQSLSLILEHYSTDTFVKTTSICIQTQKGVVGDYCGAQVLGQIRTVCPDIPILIEPM